MDLTYIFRFEAQSGINSTPHSIQSPKKSTGCIEGKFSPTKIPRLRFVSFFSPPAHDHRHDWHAENPSAQVNFTVCCLRAGIVETNQPQQDGPLLGGSSQLVNS